MAEPPISIAASRWRALGDERIQVLGVLALAVSVRAIGITQPFVDSWSWRQSLLAMIARNFYRDGFDITMPRIDVAGPAPGYVGMEFPLVPYLAALAYPLTGVADWVGRSVAVLFFAISVPFLYRLVKRVANRRSALLAIAIYALMPLSVFAGRSFMSDMATVALSVAALDLFADWLERGGGGWLAACTTATALAILIKVPSIVIGLPMLAMVLGKHGIGFVKRPTMWAFAAGALAPSLLWYRHARELSRLDFPFEWWGFQRLKTVSPERFLDALAHTVTSGLTPLVFAAMLVGLFARFEGPYRHVFRWWLVGVGAFWLVAAEGFVMHAWYALPVVPIAAALAGRGADAVLARVELRTGSRALSAAGAAAFLVAASLLAYFAVREQYRSWGGPSRAAGLEVAAMAPSPESLVVFAGMGDPSGIYYSGLRGCNFYAPLSSQEGMAAFRGLSSLGVRWIVFPTDEYWNLGGFAEVRRHLEREQTLRSARDGFRIYELTSPPAAHAAAPPPGDGIRCGCTAFGYECVSDRARHLEIVRAP